MANVFQPSFSWLLNDMEHHFYLFQQMLVRMPCRESGEKYRTAFRLFSEEFELLRHMAKLIELWDAQIPSVKQSPSFRDKVGRCSRMFDRVAESYCNELDRRNDLFDSSSCDNLKANSSAS